MKISEINKIEVESVIPILKDKNVVLQVILTLKNKI